MNPEPGSENCRKTISLQSNFLFAATGIKGFAIRII